MSRTHRTRSLYRSLVRLRRIHDDEQMAALEAFVTVISTPEGLEKFQELSQAYYEDYYDGEDEKNERENKLYCR